MNYKRIIADAWKLTQTRKDIFWCFAFGPALLSSLVSIVYLAYQFIAFTSSSLFVNNTIGDHIFAQILSVSETILTEQTGLAVFLIIMIAIIGLAYLMLPVFTQGALIQMLANIRAGNSVSIMQGFSFGLNRFLQLFEYHLAIKTFSFVSVLTYAALILRMLGLEAFIFFIWILVFFALIGFILSVLFTYSEFYIVIDRHGVFKSMLSSSGLVITHWHHTLFMFLLMIIISIRIIINILIALAIPLVVIAPIFLFASLTLTTIGIVVGVIFGLIALYFSSYFLGIFHIFATAVWTFTFLELSSKKEADGEALREQIQSQN